MCVCVRVCVHVCVCVFFFVFLFVLFCLLFLFVFCSFFVCVIFVVVVLVFFLLCRFFFNYDNSQVKECGAGLISVSTDLARCGGCNVVWQYTDSGTRIHTMIIQNKQTNKIISGYRTKQN